LLPVDAIDESAILWFEIPSVACTHALNAYDSATGVVLYLVQTNDFELTKLIQFSDAQLVRYDIDLSNNTISSNVEPTRETLREKFGKSAYMELPFVNPRVYGKVAKYAFATVFAENENEGWARNAGIVKYNLETSSFEGVIEFDGIGLGEAVLTTRENDRDGYISAFVRDTSGTALQSSEPLAVVHGPTGFHIPISKFHSQFISEDSLNSIPIAEV